MIALYGATGFTGRLVARALAARRLPLLLVAGRSVSEIASELNVAGSTVSNHVTKIREKLGARTVGEIIRYAHQAGFLS